MLKHIILEIGKSEIDRYSYDTYVRYIYKNVCHRHIGISFYIYKIYFDTYIYIQYNGICRFYFLCTSHTYEVPLRRQRSYFCGKTIIQANDNTSTIFKWMKIIDNFYYQYYHFHDPSTLLAENNTMILQIII